MGFIKIDRDIVDWQYFNKEPMLKLWIYLLCSASYKDNYYDGRLIKKGQLVVGRKKLSEKLGLSEQVIRTCLNRLKLTGEITIESTNKYSVITITKWGDYQAKPEYINQQDNQDVNQPVTNNQPTINQQVTTTKEIKEVLEFKESFIKQDIGTDFEDEILKESPDYKLENCNPIDMFETEFGRTISSSEAMRISQMISDYGQLMVMYALREALTYDALSLDYIDRVLTDWKKRELTTDDYEEGKR